MISRSPHQGLLILVHGLRTNFDFALRGTAFLAHVLDINAPVMVFDWPANQGSSLRGYRRAQRLASASAAELADVVRLILQEVRPGQLWLVANSLAGQVVVDAVGLLAQDPDLSDAGPRIDHVVLTAPDVTRTGFKDGFKADLASMVKHTTIYVSSNDRALLLSRVVNLGPRLGQSTLSKADAELVDEVQDLLGLLEPGGTGVTLVDVTPVNRTRNFHNFSLEVPEYFDDMYLRLVNPGTPLNRLRYQFVTPAGSTYSVLTRAR
jgi:esterase/lipase superfamily enzyme